jgi:flagellar hook assembly protein FlgD
MHKKLLSILGALALAAGLAAGAAAQQLYVSHITVGDDAPNADGFCNGPAGGSSVIGNDRSFVNSITGNVWNDSALIEFERPRPTAYPGSCLSLCAKLVCVSTAGYFGVDELTFEIFKFGSGANPLDPASTPPIKTISMYNIGTCQSDNNVEYNIGGVGYYYCTAWDGSYNINGIFGKTNGQYGFRAKVRTNQVSPTAGNISIEQTAAYPGQNQIPIQVNVTNIHSVRSSPTVVGRITGVAAQPYNVHYRLSKDAIVNMNVYDVTTNPGGSMDLVRTVLVNTPRVGEGTPDGTLTNGDFWDGRDNDGNLVAGGNYILRIEAQTYDHWAGVDLAWPATVQISLDPLQITDVAVKPLGASATDMAVISYLLTEAATVYVDIYTPGTNVAVNDDNGDPTYSGGTRLRRFKEQKDRRLTTSTLWDGRDDNGRPVCDGNYVYSIYAEVPSSSDFAPLGKVRTRRTMVGVIPIARGNVVALVNPSSTVIGSSPSVAGLDPFYFRYTPSRDTFVKFSIKEMNGTQTVRTVINNEMRFANFQNREIWDGKNDAGRYVLSGSYLGELVTTDPYQCAALKTSTVTVQFPVNMFRTVDMKTTPLMGGTSDMARIQFEFSQPMYMTLNVYAPGAVVDPNPWPPTVTNGVLKYTVEGIRPGRFRITEYWDGRDTNGRMVEDGRYPFTLVAYSSAATQQLFSTDQTYGYVDVSRGKIIFTSFDVIPTIPQMYNSSDTVKLPPYEIAYSLTRQSLVAVQILDANGGGLHGQTVAHVLTESRGVRDGDMIYQEFWDGRYSNLDGNGYIVSGDFVPSGSYDVRVTAKDIDIDPLLNSMATVQMTIDVDPLRIYDVSIIPLTLDNPAVLSYQVSEPMKVVTKIYKPGTAVPPGDQDPPVGLVKRIIGVRPSRTQISEYWDGTDLTLSKVGDGNYSFKIYGSTVTDAISTIDGSITSTGYLAPDVISANIPVTRGGTSDLCGDFANESFFAPNPYTGTKGWFKIPIIMNGWVSLRVYNIAGDLVYKRNYGDVNNPREGGANIDGAGRCVTTQTHEACWPKVNTYGRTVAPGVYFAVMRYEATDGTRDVCQVVKKLLLP